MEELKITAMEIVMLVVLGFLLGVGMVSFGHKKRYERRAVELEWAHYDAKTGDLKWTHFNGYYLVTGRKLDKEQD